MKQTFRFIRDKLKLISSSHFYYILLLARFDDEVFFIYQACKEFPIFNFNLVVFLTKFLLSKSRGKCKRKVRQNSQDTSTLLFEPALPTFLIEAYQLILLWN